MLRMLIIQQFSNLSDEQLEIQVLDRLSFHRFVKFAFYDDVPDSNTSKAVYMDRGDDGKPTYNKLKEKRYSECIQRKGKGKGKLKRTRQRHQRLSKTREVEHIFAPCTEMGGKLIRSIEFERAKLQVGLKACMYNLRHLSVFKHSG